MRNMMTTAATAIALTLTTAGCMTMEGGMNDVAYVDGAAMYASQNIIENAVNSPIHTTLVAAVQQAQLVDTLSGPGPFTVFAPTDEAFSQVPAATRNSLMMDQNRAMLQSVLTYHVVPGRVTAADLMQRINAGGGTAMVQTVQVIDQSGRIYQLEYNMIPVDDQWFINGVRILDSQILGV